MDNSKNVETWDQLKMLGVEGIVKYFNDLLGKGNTIEDIMTTLGAARKTGSRYLGKRGYRYNGTQFVPKEGEDLPMVTDTPAPSQKIAPVKPKTTKQPIMDVSLRVYADVHETLSRLDTTDYVRTSISLAKETNQKLGQFLKDKPLLKKQDFITHALELAMGKYGK